MHKTIGAFPIVPYLTCDQKLGKPSVPKEAADSAPYLKSSCVFNVLFLYSLIAALRFNFLGIYPADELFMSQSNVKTIEHDSLLN